MPRVYLIDEDGEGELVDVPRPNQEIVTVGDLWMATSDFVNARGYDLTGFDIAESARDGGIDVPDEADYVAWIEPESEPRGPKEWRPYG